MKEFKLLREIRSNKATLGRLIDSDYNEICKTLENPWLNNYPEISCIPEGTYKWVKDDEGRFKYWKLLDVLGRSNIEMHPGNKEKDTKGCILLGQDWVIMDDELAVNSSRNTFDRIISEALLPDEFELEIF